MEFEEVSELEDEPVELELDAASGASVDVDMVSESELLELFAKVGPYVWLSETEMSGVETLKRKCQFCCSVLKSFPLTRRLTLYSYIHLN